MSKKADIIKLDVILLTKKVDIDLNVTIIKECFNECRLFKNTHSIKKDNWTYYCKNENFYCDYNYCLIIDVNKEQDAFNIFKDTIKDKLTKDINTHKGFISKLEKQFNNVNKL